IDDHNIDSVHTATYRHAQSELPPAAFEKLTDASNDYRKKNFENAAYFHEQLPLYSIKPFYVLLIYLFYKAGVSLIAATILPSVLSYICIGALLFLWMSGIISLLKALIFSVLIMLSPPMWEIALSATPDALSGFLAFLAFFLIVEKRKIIAGLSLLLLCITVRIDFVFLALMTLFFLRFSKATEKRITLNVFLLFSILSVLIFSVIAFGPGNFNRSTIGYYTIVQSDFVQQFGYNPGVQYLVLLVKGIYGSRYSVISLFLLLAMVLFFISKNMVTSEKKFELQIVFLLLLNIGVRYLLHPVIEDRFLVAHYLIITVIFLKTLFGQKMDASIRHQ
ncbi:MAG: hypothetical protein ABIO46_01695, partial [Chitinophagales bacterium]